MADPFQTSGSSKPGKTSPRIEQDLLDYDARNPRRDGRNLLFDPPPHFGPKKNYYRTAPTDCRHNLWLKSEQTKTQPAEQPITTATQDIVSLICSNCSYHFDVVVDCTKRPDRTKPCGDDEYPLHHWRSAWIERPDEAEKQSTTWKYDKYTEKQTMACSAPDCPAVLVIKVSPPRLSRKQMNLLEDAKIVQARGNKMISEGNAKDPVRFAEYGPSEPAEVLNILRTYLTNSLEQGGKDRRRIAARNKRFLLAFGDDCNELLQYIGFEYQRETTADDDREEAFWILPAASPPPEPAIGDVSKSMTHFVEDILWEVIRKLLLRPPEERTRTKSGINIAPVSGLQSLRVVLGSLKYDKDDRPIDLDADEHPHYAGLGAVGNFSDKLVLWAYQRQIHCDSDLINKAYYLQCLRDISEGRHSAYLQEEYAMIASLGQPTLSEIEDAYRVFSLEPDVEYDDGHIIGTFQSRIEDSAPAQKVEAKRALAIIGQARNSQTIKDAASDKAMTYEEALTRLGVTADTPSDSIMASAVAYALDLGRDTVGPWLSVIGNTRGDINLQVAGSEMEMGESEVNLTVEDAYNRLQVADHNVSEEVVFSYYQQLIKDAPAGSKSSYGNALRVIATARQSTFLFTKLADPEAVVQPKRSTADQPVGLDNIGNTCYLNSLLQYFYTVRNFREVVMNIERYRMPLDAESIKQKRAGGRAVDKAEIIKAQQFVDALHDLYKNLKSASTQSVRPTQDLAELTLLTTEAEESFRRASVSSPTAVRASLAPFSPPPPPPPHSPPSVPIRDKEVLEDVQEDVEMVDVPPQTSVSYAQHEAVSSGGQEQKQQPEAIGEAPTNAQEDVLPDEALVNGQTSIEQPPIEQDNDYEMVNGAPPTPPPEVSEVEIRPPIPPRNKPAPINTSAVSEDDLRKQRLSFGAQQDVTEVIGNVLFRMSCAIKPIRIDDKGVQIDSIHDTFYGTSRTHLYKNGTYKPRDELWNNIIVYPAPQGARDIYDAIDVVYDEQTVALAEGDTTTYTTIVKLPPIIHIQIQRTAFDKVTQTASKNQNPVLFPETIFMDRYMEDEQAIERRREGWKWKTRIRQLEARIAVLQSATSSDNPVPIAEALKGTKDFLEGIGAEGMDGIDFQPELIAELETRSLEVTAEFEQLNNELGKLRAKLHEHYTHMRQHSYRLQAVFMHRGSNAYGHYWIYIYDFANDIWREYNDDRVSIVDDRRKILEPADPSNPSTAYFLAYVRDEEKDNLVDAVVREINEETPAPTDDLLHNPDAMDEDAVEIVDGVQHVENYNPQLDPRRSDQEGDGTDGGEAWKDMQAGAVSQDVVKQT